MQDWARIDQNNQKSTKNNTTSSFPTYINKMITSQVAVMYCTYLYYTCRNSNPLKV